MRRPAGVSPGRRWPCCLLTTRNARELLAVTYRVAGFSGGGLVVFW
jgi:hypothetical protein